SWSQCPPPFLSSCFFFHAPAPSALSTLSLHDALPISANRGTAEVSSAAAATIVSASAWMDAAGVFSSWEAFATKSRRIDSSRRRSEEHTSELQSRGHLVCRLLLEKKKKLDNRLLVTQI